MTIEPRHSVAIQLKILTRSVSDQERAQHEEPSTTIGIGAANMWWPTPAWPGKRSRRRGGDRLIAKIGLRENTG